jgi:hypothetical protein
MFLRNVGICQQVHTELQPDHKPEFSHLKIYKMVLYKMRNPPWASLPPGLKCPSSRGAAAERDK